MESAPSTRAAQMAHLPDDEFQLPALQPADRPSVWVGARSCVVERKFSTTPQAAPQSSAACLVGGGLAGWSHQAAQRLPAAGVSACAGCGISPAHMTADTMVQHGFTAMQSPSPLGMQQGLPSHPSPSLHPYPGFSAAGAAHAQSDRFHTSVASGPAQHFAQYSSSLPSARPPVPQGLPSHTSPSGHPYPNFPAADMAHAHSSSLPSSAATGAAQQFAQYSSSLPSARPPVPQGLPSRPPGLKQKRLRLRRVEPTASERRLGAGKKAK